MPGSPVHSDKYSLGKPDSQDLEDEIISFRIRLDELVRRRFGSVTKFLATTGYHKSTYYGWTKGPGFPEMAKLFEMAKILGIPVREFFLSPGAPSDDSAQRALLALRDLKEKAAQAEAALAKSLGISIPTAPTQTELDHKLDATRPKPGKRKGKTE